MLNKNQSNRRNSLKYAAILPLLAFFMMQFQVKTVAQEKAPREQAPEKKEIIIDKNSSDAYLEEQSEKLKKQGMKIKFSNIKRNAGNEITSIRIFYKGSDGTTINSYQNGDEPIKPFKIIQNGGKIAINHTSTIYINKTKNNKKDVADSADNEFDIIEMDMPVPPAPPTPPAVPGLAATPPPAVNFPTPPAAPGVPYDENSEAWKDFEKKMERFSAEMNEKEGEMAKFEKDMEEYSKKMEKAFPKDFEKQMAEFGKKMEKFSEEMKAYQDKLSQRLKEDSK
ncbi:MAG TPA: hypothetical protein VFR70_05105 [Flavobacterium sp.]|nr:hypothetical protein [Flavobacterium sp.]